MLGVSVLGTDSKAKFAKKYGLSFPLLADEDHAVADRYGAWQQKSMYGRKYMGIARITYLIGPDGRVVQRWDSVKPAEHPAEVLAAVTALPSVDGSGSTGPRRAAAGAPASAGAPGSPRCANDSTVARIGSSHPDQPLRETARAAGAGSR